MANSGTVTAGSAALASQYNNLRDDVLNVSTGHTHTGASENGKKVLGTALDTTGATSGQVLTANGSGGATFAAIASSGALSLSTATAAFSTASAGTASFTYPTGAANRAGISVTQNGTVFMTLSNHNNYGAAARTLRIYNIGNTTPITDTAIGSTTGGTSIMDQIGGAGFAAGTSFAIKENLGSGGTWTFTLRKFTRDGTNSWNTQLSTMSFTGNNSESNGPFGGDGGGDCSVRWAQTLGAWYGGDRRTTAMATATTGQAGTASVWLVNDVSGSAYSAVFGTASTAGGASTYTTVFVPDNNGTPTAGTVHAWGVARNAANTGNDYRYCKYTAGSASITAASTANNTLFSAVDQPYWAIWDAATSLILLGSINGITALDRTGSTVVWRTPPSAAGRLSGAGGDSGSFIYMGPGASQAAPEQHYDLTTGFSVGGAGRASVRKFGSVGPAMFPHGYVAYGPDTTQSGQSPLVGSGSATHFLLGNSDASGTVYQYPLVSVARVLIAGTASNTFREVTPTMITPAQGFVSFDAPGSYEMISAGGSAGAINISNYQFYAQQVTLIAPGTVEVYANVANMWGASNLTYVNAGTSAFLTQGGTATVQTRTITLA
jgi:hypothetical protein